MSLDNPQPQVTYALGLLAAKDFDNPALLDDLLGPKLAQIRHLFTNGVNGLVTDFARANGVPFTVYPVHGGRGLPASTRDIVEASEVVLIIATPGSKSAGQIERICKEREAKEPAFRWRTETYDPSTHWKGKVCKVAEILSCMTVEERSTGWAKSVWEALES